VNLTAGDFAGQLTPQGFCLLERSNTLAHIDSPIIAPSFWKVKKYLITKDFTINGLLIVEWLIVIASKGLKKGTLQTRLPGTRIDPC
jgi:hypothetical protein